MTSSSLISLFSRSSILFFLLVMYLRSWNFYLNTLEPHEKPGEWYHFITFWNFYFQTIYTSLALVGTLVELVSRKEVVKKTMLENFMTNVLCPSTVFVVAAFWVLFLYEPSLVRQKGYHVPDWFNHTIHTHIFFLPVSEFFFLPRVGRKFHKTVSYMAVLSTIYWAFMEYLAHNGVFPYPMYQKLLLDQRILLNLFFMIFVMPFCCSIAYTLRYIIQRLKG